MSEKIAIGWSDLTVSVQTFLSKNNKIILNNIFGEFRFNSINALMGSSGSGKTTLIKCLNASNEYDIDMDSKIYVNSKHKIHSCFVNQDQNQYLLKGLTVFQSMIFSSKLKNSCEKTKVNHELNVNDILSELLISDIKNNLVENCSGGQLKRLSIALELTSIQMPNILFIDEPTTGLDSNAAEVVVKCLRNLSINHFICVITTIHQPNSDIFLMFDNIYVLAKGGVSIYSGLPTGIDKCLNDCNILCNEFQFPIEVLLEYSSKGINDRNVKSLTELNSEQKNSLTNGLNNGMKVANNGIKQNSKSFNMNELGILLMRTMLYTYVSNWRSFLTETLYYTISTMCLLFMFGSDIGKVDGCFSLYSNNTCYLLIDDKIKVNQNCNYHYIFLSVVFAISVSISTSNAISNFGILSKEHNNCWYSTGTYFCVQTINEWLQSIMISILIALINSFNNQFIDYFRLFLYFLIILTNFLCTQTLGSIVGLILRISPKTASFISIEMYFCFAMLNGFFLPFEESPKFLQIFYTYIYNTYVFKLILTSIYGFNRCEDDLTPIALYDYNIHQNWKYQYYLLFFIYNYITLKALEFIILYSLTNKIRNPLKTALKFLLNKKNENINYIKDENEFKKVYKQLSDINVCIDNEYKYLMIGWTDLSYSVMKRFPKKQIKILNEISGCAESATLNALMGPSGAGKTTLLNVLSGKNTLGLNLNSKIYLSKNKRIRSCFISQNTSEHLLQGLTVRQTLNYALKLKNSQINEEKRCEIIMNKEMIVSNMMSEMMITSTADTYVEHCSGGERKRIIIASELMSCIKPNILFIDEPTSGLDSDAAQVVIKCLKSLTISHGMCVMTSIHQPNNQLFQMFDSVYVLAKAGVCVYSGRPKDLDKHLNECDISFDDFQFPIEVLLKHSFNDTNDNHIKCLTQKTRDIYPNLTNRLTSETYLSNNGIEIRTKRFLFNDLWILIMRTIYYNIISQWILQLIQCIAMSLTIFFIRILFDPKISEYNGCLDFYDVSDSKCYLSHEDLNKDKDLNQNIIYIMSVLMFPQFLYIIITTLTFTTETLIFSNEHLNGWYSSGSYFWAKSLVDMIPVVISMIPYCYISSYYDSYDMYFIYFYVILMSCLCAQSVGHISGIIFPNQTNISLLFSFGIFIIVLLLSDIFIALKDIHYSLEILSLFSYVKYSYHSIILWIYGFNRCTDDEFSVILYQMDINDDMFLSNIILLFVVLMILKLTTLVILVIKSNSIFKVSQNNQNDS